MQVRLTVEAPDAARRDLAIEAEPTATARSFVDAILLVVGASSRVDGSMPMGAQCERTGRWLGGDDLLQDAGLRQGDVLLLRQLQADSAVGAPVAASPFELAVTSGPDAGRRWSLKVGDVDIGRDPARSAIVVIDPKVSGSHLRLRLSPSGVSISDLGSTNGSFVNGRRLGQTEWSTLEPSQAIRIGDDEMHIHSTAALAGRAPDQSGVVAFNRPPRTMERFNPPALDLERPPDEWRGPRLSIGTILVPALFGGALALVTQQVQMLGFALLTPLMAGWSFFEERRAGGKQSAEAATRFREKVRAVHAQLASAHEQEVASRMRVAPTPAEMVERARTHAPSVWERRPGDPDFLRLRLGVAPQPSGVSVRIGDGGNVSLRADAERELQPGALLPSVPVSVDLQALGSVGLAGEPELVVSVARWLLIQAAVLHSPRDLMLAAAVSPERLADWDWLKWLPQTSAETSPLNRALLATKRADAYELLDAIVSLRHEREQQPHRVGTRARPTPSLLVLLDQRIGLNRAQVSKVLGSSPELGILVIWLGGDLQDLPGDCRGIITIKGPTADWLPSGDQDPISDVRVDAISAGDALEVARALAPLRDVSAEQLAGEVPRRLHLYELLKVNDLSADKVLAGWRAWDGRLAAPVGRTASTTFELDLGRDGPHGLIAGTTGAGKSELLQTVIASLALRVPPDRLTFLLVDYKGGAAFRNCVTLPHTLGVVTDLDTHLTGRALVSLNAELKRRERILSAAGAKDLETMTKLDPARAPARLLIVIDEFATLAKEVPAFVEGVVDVAQRGRSLGVHMLLATQRPAGVVTPSIRANTNLRIALRVSDPADSEDVIDAPSAASIARELPGRGYARVGHNELFEFQAAYAGAPLAVNAERQARVREFAFDSVDNGRASVTTGSDGAVSELTRLAEVVTDAAAAGGFARQPAPWLPPLPEVVTLDAVLVPPVTASGPVAVVGLADEPAFQRQRPAIFDLAADGSLLIYGTSGSGKTTLMRTIAMSLAQQCGVDELLVYGIDLATGGLKPLEALPHCGSVIVGHDEERVMRLLRMIRAMIEARRRVLADAGVSALQGLSAAERSGLPRILLLINGYGGFVSAFERTAAGDAVEALPRLVADGRPVGIHFVIAAERRGAVPGQLSGVVPKRIVLRMGDEDEYASLGLARRQYEKVAFGPGRGFIDDGIEFQVAVVSADPSGRAQADAIAARGSELRARGTAPTAPPIRSLPDRVDLASLPLPSQPLYAVIGIRDLDLGPASLSIQDGHFVVVGPYRSGRSTALKTVASSLRMSTPGLDLHLLAPRPTPLEALGLWSTIARGPAECAVAIQALETSVRLRGAERDNDRVATVVVLDDGEELLEGESAERLASMIRRGRDHGTRIFAAVERQAARKAYGGWFAEIKKDGRALLLQPDLELDGDLFGVRLTRTAVPADLPGRGYVVERGRAELVQVATV